jgi:hypothetical protein
LFISSHILSYSVSLSLLSPFSLPSPPFPPLPPPPPGECRKYQSIMDVKMSSLF